MNILTPTFLTYAKVVRYLDRELRSLELINPS